MESTGHYHWLTALIFTEAGLDVRVVNPILAKQYTSANVRKVKTDPADAAGLARMALVADNLPPPFTLTRRDLVLRKKLAMLGSMVHQLQALEASLKSLSEAEAMLGASTSPAIESLHTAISGVKRSIRKIERECVQETEGDETMRGQAELLTSIPGVSDFGATLALAFFRLSDSATAKSWIAYAGLDVSSRESGTWRGMCKLTKRGNPLLRRRLFSAAWGAVMHDADFKSYYEKLRTEARRAHVEALVIIARKIVRTMFTVLRDKERYDRSKFMHRYAVLSVIA